MVSERQLAGERRNEQRTARQIRRTPWVVLGLTILLTLGVGVTAAIDLRRLDTPAGAAQAWVQAALIGDCERYRMLSVPAADSPPDPRPTRQLCQALRAAADAGLKDAVRTRVRIAPGLLQQGSVARVSVELQREGEPPVTHRLLLSDSGRWRVVRDAAACALVPCP
jgi:hypothetical protein